MTSKLKALDVCGLFTQPAPRWDSMGYPRTHCPTGTDCPLHRTAVLLGRLQPVHRLPSPHLCQIGDFFRFSGIFSMPALGVVQKLLSFFSQMPSSLAFKRGYNMDFKFLFLVPFPSSFLPRHFWIIWDLKLWHSEHLLGSLEKLRPSQCLWIGSNLPFQSSEYCSYFIF